MSESLYRILKYVPYKEPEDVKYYSMLRRGCGYEVECADRNGYTIKFDEFGSYTRDKAFSNVKYMEGNGCLRFNIEKDLLDSIEHCFNNLESQLKKKDLLILEAYKALEFYEDERNWDAIEIIDDICFSCDGSIDGYQHGGNRARETLDKLKPETDKIKENVSGKEIVNFEKGV